MKGTTKRKIVLGIILILLLTGISTLTLNIQPLRASCAPTTSGTITIMADGSIDPPTATDLIERDGDIYTFAKNIYFDSLVVERDNVVVDGVGHVLQGTGTGSGSGITLLGSGVTIKNVEIKGFFRGIEVDMFSGYNIISRNNIHDNGWGIYLRGGGNIISGNDIESNSWYGVYLDASLHNAISENTIDSNHVGIHYHGATHNTISGNTIANNDFGLWNAYSTYNEIYHNNFIDNAEQVYNSYFEQPDSWDNGYPSGGNYWSDYKDRYPTAAEIDDSGIWDIPYAIEPAYPSVVDGYPLCLPKKVYIPVPYHSQIEWYYCGPASVQMVFDYYGEEISQDEIAEAATTQEETGGSYGDDLLRAARFSDLSTSEGYEIPGHITGYTQRGLCYVAFQKVGLSMTQLKALISQGYPIIVDCQIDDPIWGTFGHFRVVVGYDDTRADPGLIIHDPLYGRKYNATYEEFEHGGGIWSIEDGWSGNWGLFVHPWDVNVAFSPQSIVEGDTFSVEVEATFPCPDPFSGDPSDTFDQCQATIDLPSGFTLVPGELPTKTLGTGEILPGESALVSWDVVAEVAGSYEIGVEAEERWQYRVEHHPSYYEHRDCDDRVGGTACARAPPIRVSTATGTGTAAFTPDNGTLIDLEAVDLSTLPPHPDGLVGFPDGLFSFTIEGLEHGQEVTVLIELVSPFPEGSLYWKCQNDIWYSLPIGSDDGDNFITVTLTDGGVGDAIAGPDGKIEDPGGPGTPPLIEGDVNGDGIVDIEDVVIAALCFGSTVAEPNIVGSPYDPRADLNNDGIIDILDLVIIGVNFGKRL